MVVCGIAAFLNLDGSLLVEAVEEDLQELGFEVGDVVAGAVG